MSLLAQIRWDKRFSVKCRYIDEQHQKLVEIVNDFFSAVQQKKGRVILASILNRLVKYAEEHFQDEETIAATAGFPSVRLERHKEEHEKLTLEIFHIAELYGSEKDLDKSVEETAALLKKWLMDHILSEDMEQAPYFSRFDEGDVKKVLNSA